MSVWPIDIVERFACAAPSGICFSATTDRKGVKTGWVTLAEARDLGSVAEVLVDIGARFSTSSAFQPVPVEIETDEDAEDDAERPEPEIGRAHV